MGKIFLIGGGEIIKRETMKIDCNIIREGGGKKARILFFPTAANDSNSYIENFIKYFIFLGCNNILWAKLSQEPIKSIKEKMNWATIIYLGGGSTELLIKTFKKKKIINYLKASLNKGTILAGMSAGAMALGKISIISEIEEDLKFGHGFGLLPKIICLPHYHRKYRNKLLQIKEKFPNKIIFGIPERSAVYFKDKKLKCHGFCFRL